MMLWQLAQMGFARCAAINSRAVRGLARSFFSGSGGTFGGGGGGGVPRRFSRMNLPRFTGEVLLACDVHSKCFRDPADQSDADRSA